MKSLGLLASGAGLLIALYAALVYRVSVPGGFGEDEIINIGLQQNRMMTFQFGLVLILAGVGLYAIGVVQELFDGKGAAGIAGRRPDEIGQNDAGDAPLVAREEQLPEDLQVIMDSHSIVSDGDKYFYGPYRYDRLEDALAYARLHPK